MDDQPEQTGRNQDGTFAPGVSGNPNGRPKGARAKLSESFLDTLLADFEKAASEDQTLGAAAIAAMRLSNPNEYARMIASLLAKEIDANVSGDLSPEMKRWLGVG